MLLKEQEVPQQAVRGQRGMEMSEANSDLVKGQLSELDPEVMHVIQAYNEAKVVLEVEFDLV